MSQPNAVVFLIDNDTSGRDKVVLLLRSVGLDVRVFTSAEEFLRLRRPNVPSCLVVEVRLPGIGGLELQSRLCRASVETPFIFLTAHGDIPMTVRAMKAGAIDFLTKPYRDQDLLEAVQFGIFQDQNRRERENEINLLRQRFEALTQREQETVAMVVSGLTNKAIAAQLGVTENTVKTHRHRAMEKMKAKSLPHLVKMAQKLEALGDRSRHKSGNFPAGVNFRRPVERDPNPSDRSVSRPRCPEVSSFRTRLT